jgi:ADP-heptose:LPS heptosyltransferase
VVLAPGSGGRAKCWPRPHWLQLAGALAARGERLEVLVGPAELERDDPRRWPWPAPVAAVVEPDLVPVAERLRQARAFVGNDSGTSHLAALLGVPTVAIFGPSDPAVFAPLGPRVRVLGGGDPQFRVAVPEALAALAALG